MQSIMGSKPLAKLVFQFWKYRQGMLFLTFSNAVNAFKGADAQTRREARRTLAGLFGTTMLSAGVFEMPLVASGLGAASLLAGLAGDDDEPVDFERDIRNWLHDIDPELGELLTKGAWSLASIDVSNRIGMGGLANPFSFARFTGKSGKDDFLAAAGAVAGAPFASVGDVVDGLMRVGQGDYAKGIEKLVPLKGAADVLRGIRMGTEGITTGTGETVIGAENIGTGEAVARGMGFQPLKATRYYEGNAAVQEAAKAATGARMKLIAKFAQARLRGESTEGMMGDIQSFNKRHPQQGLRITHSTLLKAVQERRKIGAQRSDTGIMGSKQLQPFQEAGRFADAGQ
jgi:hypothetical protein